MKSGDQLASVMVTEETVMHNTNEDPRLLAMAGVVAAQANAVNVGKMVEDAEQYKEKLSQMKETLRKERGEGKYLKINYNDTFSEFEKIREAYQMLEVYQDALTLSVANIEGENRNLERKVSELEE